MLATIHTPSSLTLRPPWKNGYHRLTRRILYSFHHTTVNHTYLTSFLTLAIILMSLI